MLSVVRDHDLSVLFTILAVIAFGGAVYCAIKNMLAAAAALLLVAVVIVVVT